MIRFLSPQSGEKSVGLVVQVYKTGEIRAIVVATGSITRGQYLIYDTCSNQMEIKHARRV